MTRAKERSNLVKTRRRTAELATLAIAALGALAPLAPAAQAARAPAWQISLNSHPTNFAPGALSGEFQYPEYAVIAENVGAASTSEPTTITVQLPSGIAPSATKAPRPTAISTEAGTPAR